MKKTSFKILIIMLICVFTLQFSVLAVTDTQKLQNNKEENESQISQSEEELESVQQEKSEIVTEVENLSNTIESYESEIEQLNNQIDELTNQIKESETKIAEAEAEYSQKEELLNERLVVMYEEGNTSYLDFLFSSDSIMDFISNFYLISELAQYDTELLEQIQEEKEEIEAEKANLENDKTELNGAKAEKERTQADLEVAKSQKDAQVEQLSEEEQEIQERIDQLKEDNKAIDAELAAFEAEQKRKEEEAKKNNTSNDGGSNSNDSNDSTNPGSSSSSGFIRPVAGYSITTGWYYSSGALHGASDFSGSGIYGATVMAAKDGVVAKVGALTTSYGTYVMIRHDDGWYTLYAHGIPGSVTVSVGERVSQGQKIMQVGSSGNSTGPHLHFEIRTSYAYSSRVNPQNYLPGL